MDASSHDLAHESSAASPDGGHRPGRLSPRTRAWIGMGAVLVALVLLMMIPGPDGRSRRAAAGRGRAAQPRGADEERAVVGKPAPLQFTLKDMNGVDVNLASFKGKVLLINFWATWCGPCRVEIPYLIELQKQYSRRSRHPWRRRWTIRQRSCSRTRASMQINYPLLVGNGREDLQDAYGPMWGIPVSVFVGRDGKIAQEALRHRVEGADRARDQVSCCSMIRRMLKGFTHARLACGCRLTFREGVEGSPVTVRRRREGRSLRDAAARPRSSRVRLPRSASSSDTFPPARRRRVRRGRVAAHA